MTSDSFPGPTPQMTWVNPEDPIERQNEKLQIVARALMQRIENTDSDTTTSFAYFQTAAALEERVKSRTIELEDALDQLHQSRARLASAKAEAEAAREDLSAALEAVREGFALFDPDGALVMSNSRFARLFPDVFKDIKPGLSLNSYFEKIAHSKVLVLDPGQNPEDWLNNRRSRHLSFSASFILQLSEDRWIQVSEQRTPNGGTTILQTEVTSMMRQERLERDRLLDNQAQLVRATLDHIAQGIVIFDADEHLVGWNMRLLELLPLPVEMFRIGTEFRLIADFFQSTKVFVKSKNQAAVLNWVAERERRPSLDLDVTTTAGRTLTVVAQVMPDKGFVISFTDISAERDARKSLFEINETLEARVSARTAELVEARDAAEQANRSKTRFLAAASHDLLQPLNAAKLFISSLAGTDLDADQISTTERIQSAFRSVEAILRDLLDISKLDGQTRVDRIGFPISRILDPMIGEFRALAEGKGLELRVTGKGGTIVSDPAYLRRIIQNLLSNAITYTEKGKVLVGTRRRGDHLLIEIFDTGVGIADEQQEQIFEEFHRVNRNVQGMGLGLAIVRRACRLLDHPLKMQSTFGKGTRFSLFVPLAEGSGDQILYDPPEQLPRTGDDLSNLLVLIVENEAEVRAGMVTLIDHWGASPIAVSTCAEAEAAIAEIGVAPDVILADYHLDDGVTGIEVIERLREIHGPLAAALITANHSDDLLTEAREKNIALFHKPLQPEELKAHLTR